MLKMRVFILSATLVIFAELAGAQLTPSVQTTSAPAVASAPPAAGLAESATTGPAASDPALPPVSPQPTTEDKRAYGVLPNYRTAEASAPPKPVPRLKIVRANIPVAGRRRTELAVCLFNK